MAAVFLKLRTGAQNQRPVQLGELWTPLVDFLMPVSQLSFSPRQYHTEAITPVTCGRAILRGDGRDGPMDGTLTPNLPSHISAPVRHGTQLPALGPDGRSLFGTMVTRAWLGPYPGPTARETAAASVHRPYVAQGRRRVTVGWGASKDHYRGLI